MRCSFHIQDPADPYTLYLYEAIIEQLMKESLRSWRGIFAFATGRAVRNLFIEDPDGKAFTHRGEISLIVGIDAVTDVSALEELSHLTQTIGGFDAKVFMNPFNGLFHPKISHFTHSDGSSVLIVGSGNFTSGGLKNNIEAFTIIAGNEEELLSVSAWDRFLVRHGEYIKEINEDALELARLNKTATHRRRPKIREAEPEELDIEEISEAEIEPIIEEDSKVLVARVPKAGERWNQIHYNKEVVNSFFHARSDSPQRLFLKEIKSDGTSGPEEVRPLVYSEANKNYKVEVSAKRGVEHPGSETPPIIVLREVGLRSFRYMLLMPGDSGYDELLRFTEESQSIGKGLSRVLTRMSTLLIKWTECPL